MRHAYDTSRVQYYEHQREVRRDGLPVAREQPVVKFPAYTSAETTLALEEDGSIPPLSWGGKVINGQFLRDAIQVSIHPFRTSNL